MRNNKLFILVIALLIIPMVNAQVTIDRIRGYTNNEREFDVDEDGGEFEVYKGDNIDLVVTLNNENNYTIEARLIAVLQNIDDGDDIEKDQDWYDISAEDDSSKTISFNIPNDAREDDYDLELKIEYKYNDTEHDVGNIEFRVNVMEEDKEEEEATTLRSIIGNLSASCYNSLAKSTESCISYVSKYNNCSGELSTAKEERGTYKQKSEDLQSSLDDCNTDKGKLNDDIISLNNEKNSMITKVKCTEDVEAARLEEQNKASSKEKATMMWVFLAGGGIYFYQRNKKRKMSTTTDYESQYYG